MLSGFVTRLRRLGRPETDPADAGPAPRAPEGLVVYAIGDVHGELKLLDALLRAIREDAARMDGLAPVAVFLGDYVDRGPDSRGVLDRLSADPLPGFTVQCLRGNHESAMLDFLDDPAGAADWLRFGGAETLGSYGVRASVGTVDGERCRAMRDALAARLPDSHVEFLQSLELYAVHGDYAFVHAGIRPHRPLDRQKAQDLLWIRAPFIESKARHDKVIVHGHTVVDEPEFHDNRIAIDTGAYATGILTAVALHGDARRLIQVRS